MQGSKLKKYNFLYHTAGIQQRNYPRLYPTSAIPCVQCNSHLDNNKHVGLCSAHKDICIGILKCHSTTLFDIIKDYAKSLTYGLLETIQSSPLINTSFDWSNTRFTFWYTICWSYYDFLQLFTKENTIPDILDFYG